MGGIISKSTTFEECCREGSIFDGLAHDCTRLLNKPPTIYHLISTSKCVFHMLLLPSNSILQK
jgi:hypothetical protein